MACDSGLSQSRPFLGLCLMELFRTNRRKSERWKSDAFEKPLLWLDWAWKLWLADDLVEGKLWSQTRKDECSQLWWNNSSSGGHTKTDTCNPVVEPCWIPGAILQPLPVRFLSSKWITMDGLLTSASWSTLFERHR